jgi:hypothetical protein
MAMDYPDANVHAEQRATTTTAIQKLFQMNSDFVTARAKQLAERLDHDEPRLIHVYSVVFNRHPTPDEVDLMGAFLRKPSTSQLNRWEQLCHSLLMSNEFMYVD